MKRRDFLHRTAHAAAGSALFGNWGLANDRRAINNLLPLNPDNDHVLVMIFLNGGNDALNTVVPMHQLDILANLRPHVLLDANRLLPIGNDSLAFHPSLPGMKELYDKGELCIVRRVGYEQPNLSHFRSTDIWMSGSESNEVITSGWLGRYLNLDYPEYPGQYPNADMPDPLAIELGFANSLLFQGPLANMSVVLNGDRDFYELVEDSEVDVPNTLAGDKLAHVKLIRRQSQTYGQVIRDAAQKVPQQQPYPGTSLAEQLKICARLIAGGLQTPVYKVELFGFDTHAGQVSADDTSTGLHANLLRELNDAIVAFQADLEFHGIADRVVGMTFSEFGRRVVSNASLGTDHGTAGPMFFFGKSVNGGVIGADYNIDSAMTYEDNLDHEFDFRQVYASVLEQWLCVDQLDIDNALMRPFQRLPIIQPSACNAITNTSDTSAHSKSITISPNPSHGNIRVQIEPFTETFRLELISLEGRNVRSLFHGNGNGDQMTLDFDISFLQAGSYFVQYISRTKKLVGVFQKL